MTVISTFHNKLKNFNGLRKSLSLASAQGMTPHTPYFGAHLNAIRNLEIHRLWSIAYGLVSCSPILKLQYINYRVIQFHELKFLRLELLGISEVLSSLPRGIKSDIQFCIRLRYCVS